MIYYILKISGSSLTDSFYPFTPKSDQVQISPAASTEIRHRTVWRTSLFTTTQWKMIILPNIILTTECTFWNCYCCSERGFQLPFSAMLTGIKIGTFRGTCVYCAILIGIIWCILEPLTLSCTMKWKYSEQEQNIILSIIWQQMLIEIFAFITRNRWQRALWKSKWMIGSWTYLHNKIMAVARNLCAGEQARGAPVTPVSRGVWGHAPPENFEI